MEKIWASGATFNAEEDVEAAVPVRVEADEFTLDAHVVQCTREEDGYFLDVKFEPGYDWTPERFEPKHLTDTDILLVRRLLSEIAPR